MKALFLLSWIEMKAYFRSGSAVFWTFGYPIMLLVILSMFFGPSSSDRRTITIEAVYAENQQHVGDFLEIVQKRFSFVPLLHVQFKHLIPEQANKLQAGRLRLTFPSYFAEKGEVSRVRLEAKGNIDSSIAQIVNMISESLEIYNRKVTQGEQRLILDYQVQVSSGGGGFDYHRYLIIGLAVLTVITTALIGFTSVLVGMREQGGLKMYQIFPMRKGEFLTAFILSRAFILAGFTLMFIYVSNSLLEAKIPVNWSSFKMLVLLLLVGIFFFFSIGLLLVCFIKKDSTVSAIVNFVNLPIMFLSDLFIPISFLPDFLQKIIQIFPPYLFVNAMRDVIGQVPQFTASVSLVILLFGVLGAASLAAAAKLFPWRTQ